MRGTSWLFGYGSLIWRPGFAFLERQPAWIDGYVRRFWQDSPDHRGTESAPGRVVTLVARAGGRCHGVAYRIESAAYSEIVDRLDVREREGYRREQSEIFFAEGRSVSGLVYLATENNPHFAGPAPAHVIADVVRKRRGPSGSNTEYVLRLHQSLLDMGVEDPHVSEIAAMIRTMD